MRKPTAADISNDLTTMQTWYHDLTTTKNNIITGLLQLDCTRLRSILLTPAVETIKGKLAISDPWLLQNMGLSAETSAVIALLGKPIIVEGTSSLPT